MKILVTLVLSLLAVSAFAATPTYSNFDTNHFQVESDGKTIGANTNSGNASALVTQGQLSGSTNAGSTHFYKSIWLDATNGNDSTARPNNPSKPWQTLSNAFAWCSTNPFTIMRVSPGLYDNGSNNLPAISNCYVLGADGAGRRLVTFQVTQLTNPPTEQNFMRPADNFTLDNVTLKHNGPTNAVESLFGVDTISDSQSFSATNYVVKNCDMIGVVDCVYWNVPGITNQGRFDNCDFYNGFDCLNSGGIAAASLTTWNHCRFYSTILSGFKHRCVVFNSNDKNIFNGCEFYAGNKTGTAAVPSVMCVSVASGNEVFNNCLFDLIDTTSANEGTVSCNSNVGEQAMFNNCQFIGGTNDVSNSGGVSSNLVFNSCYKGDGSSFTNKGAGWIGSAWFGSTLVFSNLINVAGTFTTNIQFTDTLTGTTNTLYFTNGLLMRTSSP